MPKLVSSCWWLEFSWKKSKSSSSRHKVGIREIQLTSSLPNRADSSAGALICSLSDRVSSEWDQGLQVLVDKLEQCSVSSKALFLVQINKRDCLFPCGSKQLLESTLSCPSVSESQEKKRKGYRTATQKAEKQEFRADMLLLAPWRWGPTKVPDSLLKLNGTLSNTGESLTGESPRQLSPSKSSKLDDEQHSKTWAIFSISCVIETSASEAPRESTLIALSPCSSRPSKNYTSCFKVFSLNALLPNHVKDSAFLYRIWGTRIQYGLIKINFIEVSEFRQMLVI